MKIVVIALLLGIVASLGRALFSMAAGPADDRHLAKPEGGISCGWSWRRTWTPSKYTAVHSPPTSVSRRARCSLPVASSRIACA